MTFTPISRELRESEQAAPGQVAAAQVATHGMRTEFVQAGWWRVYDASGRLAGDLHRERSCTGEPMLYHGYTAGGVRVPVCVAEREPVMASLLAASCLRPQRVLP